MIVGSAIYGRTWELQLEIIGVRVGKIRDYGRVGAIQTALTAIVNILYQA